MTSATGPVAPAPYLARRRPDRLLARLLRGDLSNVRFNDFRRLVEAAGFSLARQRGSHHIYRHPIARVLLNLQEVDGMTKPYQIRQFLRTMKEHDLDLSESQ